MTQQSSSLTSNAVGASSDILGQALTVQQDYNALAESYIPLLATVAGDASSSNQVAAGQAYSDAIAVRNKTTQDINTLTSLRTEHLNLSLEASLPSTTDQRRSDIQIRLSEILNEYNALGTYTKEQYMASQTLWAALSG
jgi:hypothetical protein